MGVAVRVEDLPDGLTMEMGPPGHPHLEEEEEEG